MSDTPAPYDARDDARDDPRDGALAAEILAAFTPRSARERLRQLVQRGYTAVQVYDRLPQQVREQLAGEEPHPTVAARKAKERVHRALAGLVAAGRLRQRRETYGIILNTKGGRGMIVDVYRLP